MAIVVAVNSRCGMLTGFMGDTQDFPMWKVQFWSGVHQLYGYNKWLHNQWYLRHKIHAILYVRKPDLAA